MFISPMLLEKREEPFNDKTYLFEPKVDGHRLLFSFIDGKTTLYTRNKNMITHKYPELLTHPFTKSVILDGEVAALNQSDIIDFEEIMIRFSASRSEKIKRLQTEIPVIFVVFDVLYYDGKDVRRLKLEDRKALLDEILPPHPVFQKILSVEGDGKMLYQAIQSSPFREGMVAKKKGTRYESKRSKSWLKIVNYRYDEVFIQGFRKNEFGLLLSFDQEGHQTAGILELGMPREAKSYYFQKIKDIKIKEDERFVYTHPVHCRVKCRNLTHKGLLRSPSFVSF